MSDRENTQRSNHIGVSCNRKQAAATAVLVLTAFMSGIKVTVSACGCALAPLYGTWSQVG